MIDLIADYLTRLRNVIKARYHVVEIPASNIKKDTTKILFNKGYILDYMFEEERYRGTIKVVLKYDSFNKVSVIKCLKRVSRPGLCKYVGYKDIPRVLNGLGIAILFTLHGVMTDKKAREPKTGGEVLCYIY